MGKMADKGQLIELAKKISENYAKVAELGTFAKKSSLAASDIPALDASKITTGTFADARIASAATWNAKQEAISDLSSIRTNASLGAIANTWGNHANAGYYNAGNSNKTTVDWSAKNLTLAGALSGATSMSTTGTVTCNSVEGKYIMYNDSETGMYMGLAKNGIGNTYTGGLLWAYGNNPLYFYTNNYQRMVITGAGNVGIGTASPSARLQVKGGLLVLFDLLRNGTEGGAAISFSNTNGRLGRLGVDANGGLLYSTGAADTELFRIKANGNVGIGTSSPAVKLHVEGGVLSIKNNGNSISIGSQNGTYNHIYSSAPIYCGNDISMDGWLYPFTDGEKNLGKNGKWWNEAYINKIYLNGSKNDTDAPYITYDSTNHAFHVVGNLYADGFISAGGKSDSQGGGGGDVLGISFDGSTIINSTNGVLYVGASAIPISRIDGLSDTLAGKQAVISDLATIRSNAANGNTAYGWGNHALQGYLTQHQDISGKQDKITSSNKLAYSLISGTPTSLPASDVYAWAKAATKPSYGWTEITGKPNVIAIKTDGVAEAGQYFDFHHTDDTTSDYNVRLACPNVSLQTVNLPSESGTLALTKDFLPLTGGTLTGSLACEGLSVKYGDYGSRINLRYSSTNSGGYHCIYTQNDDSMIRFSATNSNGTSWTYQDYLLVTRDGNVAAKGWIRSGNGGYGVRLAADNTINGMNGNAYGNLYLQDASANNLYLCTGGGKVGIGTNNPSYKLHVDGGIATKGGANNRFCEVGQNDFVWHTVNNTAGWAGGLVFANNDGTVSLGHAAGAFGNGNGSLAYFFYGGSYNNAGICIDTNKNVGIGTTTPASKLHVSGNILATGQITAGSASDIRLKDNITSLCNAASILRNLHGVEFDWNAIATENCTTLKGHDVGMIAQDVERYIPSAVSPIFEKYKRLDYTKLVPYLVEGWKGHDDEIARLKARVNKLETELAKLR